MNKSAVVRILIVSGICIVIIALAASGLFATNRDILPAAMISEPNLLWNPGRLEVDHEQVLYVVDAYQNRVHRFDRSGRHLGFIKVDRPSAVAAGPGGTVYIGSHRDYSVAISRKGVTGGFLGKGKNEFSSVLDIAVDQSTGDVYVVDGIRQAVKVYSSKGVPQATFSGLHSPVGVSVAGEEVYVLDAPQAAGGGAPFRVSVFSRTGSFLRSIEDGAENGPIRPVDIAVDAFGNLFVADAARQTVLVYDRRGSAVGEIRGKTGVFKNPVSLALAPDGRLYVGSSETHSVIEIGLSGIAYSPTSTTLDFQTVTGGKLTTAVLGY